MKIIRQNIFKITGTQLESFGIFLLFLPEFRISGISYHKIKWFTPRDGHWRSFRVLTLLFVYIPSLYNHLYSRQYPAVRQSHISHGPYVHLYVCLDVYPVTITALFYAQRQRSFMRNISWQCRQRVQTWIYRQNFNDVVCAMLR